MSRRLLRASKVALGSLLVVGAFGFRLSAFPQECPDADPQASKADTTREATPEFEAKIVPGKVLVRKKGDPKWTEASKLTEIAAVGRLDGDHKIYVVTKAIKAPKLKHGEDPKYPEMESASKTEGKVVLHLVVDDKGFARQPAVDASTGPEFSHAAIDAVQKWTFTPASLNNQPVAVLISVEVNFNIY